MGHSAFSATEENALPANKTAGDSSNFGGQHPDTAKSYNDIGINYEDMGNYPKALEYHLKALAIREKILSKQHPDTAESYNNIGRIYGGMGNYPEALKYLRKAFGIQEKILGKQHPNTATSYNNIGKIYDAMGDYSKALEYELKSLVIREKILGKKHPDTATSYNNIGKIYDAMGDYSKALEYELKSLVIREKILGKKHPDTATSYNNIGKIYGAMGDYSKALEYESKSLAIREKVLGKQHPDTALSYNNIGKIYGVMDDHSKALEYQLKSLVIREEVLGKQHPHTAISYNNIGSTYNDMGDHSKAYQYTQKAFAIFLQQRHNNFFVLDTSQKKQYLSANERMIDNLLHYTNKYQQTLLKNRTPQQAIQLVQTTLNDWLAYKGSILDSENRLVSFAKTSKDPAIQQKYQQLVTLKQSYSTLNQSYPSEKQQEAWKQQLKQHKTQIAALERDITQTDPRFKDKKALQKITSKAIANGLNEKELYIDYGRTGSSYYLFTIDHDNRISFTAFSKKDSKTIDQQIALFTDDIDAIITDNKKSNDLRKGSQAILGQLFQLLIPPTLATKIANKDRLIISPDRALHLLPFGALYNQSNKQYLVQQKDIRYIANGKEFVRLSHQQQQSQTIKNNKVVIFANPDFGEGMAFAPLPGTKIEAEAIIDILESSSNIRYYSGKNASEANLLSIHQPAILHIATTGFFNADTPNSILQSGLILAGANASIARGRGEGIVTALDLSGLDLKGTELVVLSACDTGKIDPSHTNGVSGLTKAFMQAGSKLVIVSLWQIADKETAELMQTFYQKSKDNGSQYASALKHSKLVMIKKGLHPYYWAGFVLHGL